MRIRPLTVLALAGLAAARFASAQQTAAQVEANDAQFLKLTTEVQGAVQAKDVAALDRMFAKDFAFSMFVEGKRPQVLNRDEFLKLGELYTLERFELKNLAARVFGSVAVVRFQSLRAATLGPTDRSGEFAVVDTWVKQGDTWRLSIRYLGRPDPGLSASR
jgi:hypothetical protein